MSVVGYDVDNSNALISDCLQIREAGSECSGGGHSGDERVVTSRSGLVWPELKVCHHCETIVLNPAKLFNRSFRSSTMEAIVFICVQCARIAISSMFICLTCPSILVDGGTVTHHHLKIDFASHAE